MDLLACPFCGSEDLAMVVEGDGGMPGSQVINAYIQCSCKARGPAFADWGNPSFKEDAMRAWNKRDYMR